MSFKLKSARYHPLQGLEVTGEDGVSYLTHTKRSVLEAGAVLFIPWFGIECPHKVKFSFKEQDGTDGREYVSSGTDDPATLRVARRYEFEKLEYSEGWLDILTD